MVVVDSSAVLAVLFGEAEAPTVLRALAAAGGSGVSAPDFLAVEVANALIQARRKARRLKIAAAPSTLLGCPEDRFAELLRARIEALGLVLEPFPGGTRFDRVCALADALGLTTYDALYLALAESQRASLMTLDAALIAAAPAVGVKLTAGRP